MSILKRCTSYLRRFAAREDGSITVDFVLVLPVYLAILLSSFEAGYSMVRLVMMERALDITVRDLRVGAMGDAPTHAIVRTKFCQEMVLMPNCMTEVKLEMRVVNRTTWTGFSTPATCVDRTTVIEPVLQFTQGGSNEIVTIRSCAVFDPFFPTTRWGLGLQRDASGGYQMASMTVFVNEPRGAGGGGGGGGAGVGG
jgi:Flp pilus assembly protein TadG